MPKAPRPTMQFLGHVDLAVFRPPAEGFAEEIEDNTERTPEGDESGVRHNWRDEAGTSV